MTGNAAPPTGARRPRTDRGPDPQAAGFRRYAPNDRLTPGVGFRKYQMVARYLRRP